MTRTQWRQQVQTACLASSLALLLFQVTQLFGQIPAEEGLSALSLEQLTTIDVSSVARRDQHLYKSPSAVFVITQSDIRRSGADNIPELLRIVPGVQVAQIEGNKWAVSVRGFNSEYANKMLVMIDGRSIYNMVWSDTYWDMYEMSVADIERIEVIRGPGATMWGANAVNGVINIITKKAKQTIGSSISVSEGRMDRGASIRYGGDYRGVMQYRVSLKYQAQPALVLANGASANDAGKTLRAAGRVDWQPTTKDSLLLRGAMFRGREDQTEYSAIPGPITIIQDKTTNSGAYSLLRWEHKNAGSDFALQGYFNVENRKELRGNVRWSSADIDFQHHLTLAPRNDFTWGLGARVTSDQFHGTPVPFVHDHSKVNLFSSFLQNEFAIVQNKLVFTAGSKFQWNSYTHVEVQPGIHLLWTPDVQHSIWASLSRSVRTPSFNDRDLKANVPVPSSLEIPMQVMLLGSPLFKSEHALTYEAGYRERMGKRVSVDLASFYYHYTRLESQNMGTAFLVPYPIAMVVLPITYANDYHAHSEGLEAVFSWNPTHAFRFGSSYAWMQAHLAQNGVPSRLIDTHETWSTPRNTLEARAAWNFARRWTADASIYAASSIPILADPARIPATPVPAYQRVDVSADYSVGESVVFKAGIRNVQEARHIEFNPQNNSTIASEIPRTAFVKATWSF
jgi:iron complex outermembrane receptor protein